MRTERIGPAGGTRERSEYAANEGQAPRAIANEAKRLHRERERADWRTVLAKREAKRAHRQRRTARRAAAQSGAISRPLLVFIATAAGAIVGAARLIFGA